MKGDITQKPQETRLPWHAYDLSSTIITQDVHNL